MRRRPSPANRDDRGSVAVLTAIAFVPLSLVLAVVVDGGRVWAERQRLQDQVESAALSVAGAWAVDGSNCAAASLGAVASADTVVACDIVSDAAGDTAEVSASRQVRLSLASLLGREVSTVTAATGVRIGAATAVSGVRPVALCAANPALDAWVASGTAASASQAIYFDAETPDCGADVAGNWAVLDLDGGANSMSDAQTWIENGFPGTVTIGDAVNGDPGIPSPALQIDSIVGQTVVLPVFDNPRLDGANAVFDVVGFVRVRIDAAALSGAAAQRHVRVTFLSGVTRGAAHGAPALDFGLTAWSVCSFDTKGSCS